MTEEISRIQIDKEFKICPVCGYKDGFHSIFESLGEARDFGWILICPSCHTHFDIGLQVHIPH